MSLNKFIGIGNITRDAEVREVGQSKVARFAIAMNEKFRKQDGTVGETTEFMEVELWNQVGVFQYLRKGQLVYVEGSIRTEKWTGNDGVEKTSIKLRAMSVQLLGRPQATTPAQPQATHAPSFPPQPGYAQPTYSAPVPPTPTNPYAGRQQVPPPTNVFAPPSDDLPF